jgi:hypothetical protein
LLEDGILKLVKPVSRNSKTILRENNLITKY